jgi:hypothetical protein
MPIEWCNKVTIPASLYDKRALLKELETTGKIYRHAAEVGKHEYYRQQSVQNGYRFFD